MSYLDSGPLLAKELLAKTGIHLVVEAHLSKTFLDGAAIRLPNGAPLVALTLRHDRLDNFWFTLCHELAHVGLHLDRDDADAYFDDLNGKSTEHGEREADAFASEALIPKDKWKAAKLGSRATAEQLVALAEELRVNSAVVAGRYRFETNDYKRFQELIGRKSVRASFFPSSAF